MLGSWGCLLLGWGLLLGQPVRGVEEDWDDPQAPLEEDLEEPLPSLEEMEEWDGRVMPEEGLTEDDPRWESMRDRFSVMALDFFNKKSYGPLYKMLEEDQIMMFKKAIGTMAYLRLFLGKTNCTNDVQEENLRWVFLDPLGSMRKSKIHPCVLPPKPERKTLDCTFDVFLDERSHWEAVVGHHCEPLEIDDSFETDISPEW